MVSVDDLCQPVARGLDPLPPRPGRRDTTVQVGGVRGGVSNPVRAVQLFTDRTGTERGVAKRLLIGAIAL